VARMGVARHTMTTVTRIPVITMDMRTAMPTATMMHTQAITMGMHMMTTVTRIPVITMDMRTARAMPTKIRALTITMCTAITTVTRMGRNRGSSRSDGRRCPCDTT
jgi:hypothetical protein